MSPHDLFSLLYTIAPLSILEKCGITNVPKELEEMHLEIMKSSNADTPPIQFYVTQKGTKIEFCWRFPFRHETLVIECLYSVEKFDKAKISVQTVYFKTGLPKKDGYHISQITTYYSV